LFVYLNDRNLIVQENGVEYCVNFEAGDVFVFDGRRLVHGGAKNHTGSPEYMYFAYLDGYKPSGLKYIYIQI
jgi:ectoine hydroxylase-related dioxygenase (phytanoyl-CoA dioxygenase family)